MRSHWLTIGSSYIHPCDRCLTIHHWLMVLTYSSPSRTRSGVNPTCVSLRPHPRGFRSNEASSGASVRGFMGHPRTRLYGRPINRRTLRYGIRYESGVRSPSSAEAARFALAFFRASNEVGLRSSRRSQYGIQDLVARRPAYVGRLSRRA